MGHLKWGWDGYGGEMEEWSWQGENGWWGLSHKWKYEVAMVQGKLSGAVWKVHSIASF